MTRPVNPYIAGAPLRGETGFFGRRDTLDWVANEVRNPASNALVLFGQRRIGKTTLLLQLQRTLPANICLPIYFDLQDQAARPLSQVLANLADTVTEAAQLDVPIPSAMDDEGDMFQHTFLPQLYKCLGETRRPVFLLDEFDVLEQTAEAELPGGAAAKALFPFLRRLMAEDSRPAFVFVVGRRAEDLSLNFMATFKASLIKEIWVLDRESAEAVVLQAEANDTLHFSDQAVARILSLTGNHPYLTQLLCQRIWEGAYVGNPAVPPFADVPQVEATIRDTLATGHQALAWLWEGLNPAEKIYAAALAETAEEGQIIPEDHLPQVLAANADRLRTREVELAPRDLVKRRVLKEAEGYQYQFAVELLRRWVRQHKPLRDVKDELDQLDPLAEQLFVVGQGFFHKRKWENSIRYFREALEANPRHFRARLNLGEALLELGRTDEAVAELEHAYELDKEEVHLPLARALVAVAKAQEQARNENGALTASERALQLSPNERAAQEIRAAILTRHGRAALQAHKFDEALAAYQESGQMADLVDGLLQVAQWWSEAEQLEAYDWLLKVVPDYEETRQRRKVIWLRRGNIALERNELETALTAYRETGDGEKIAQVETLLRRRALATLEGQARTHAEAQKWVEAASVYEQLTAQAPDEESRATWQTALEQCKEEEELARLFAEGRGALEQEDWKRAQRAFADLVHCRPVYQQDGLTAAKLLDLAVTEKKAGVPTQRSASLRAWLSAFPRQAIHWWTAVVLLLPMVVLAGGIWSLANLLPTPTPTLPVVSSPTATLTPTLVTGTPTVTVTPSRTPTPTNTPTPSPKK